MTVVDLPFGDAETRTGTTAGDDTEKHVRLGLARQNITYLEPGTLLLGWANPANRAERVGDPIEARALAVQSAPNSSTRSHGARTHGARTHGARTIVFVTTELCFVSQALREAVRERISDLELADSDWMLTATHNHSGPSGLSHGLFYNLVGRGFHAETVAHLADGIATCIRQAVARLQPGRLEWTRHPLPEWLGINRSWEAFNRNPDSDFPPGREPLTARTRGRGVNREATLLMAVAEDGTPLGAVQWFGLHGTTVHADNTQLRHDHKGMASRLWEADPPLAANQAGPAGLQDFVALFAQGPAADVTPNSGFDAARGIAALDTDDLAARDRVGRAQYRAAADAWGTGETLPADTPVAGVLRYVPMEHHPVDPDLATGVEAPTTTRAVVGMGLGLGTAEGPGPYAGRRWMVRGSRHAMRLLAAARRLGGKPLPGTPRWPLIDVGLGRRGRLWGMLPAAWVRMPRWLDADVAYGLNAVRNGLGDHPWVPTTLPLQILRIGPLAIVGMPCEPSTIAGQRMAATVRSALAHQGVQHVVVNGYANGYASYCVTPEEYDEQHYEGACTLFGRWTLPAWQTEARSLARELGGEAPPTPRLGPWLLPEDAIRAQPIERPTPRAPTVPVRQRLKAVLARAPRR